MENEEKIKIARKIIFIQQNNKKFTTGCNGIGVFAIFATVTY